MCCASAECQKQPLRLVHRRVSAEVIESHQDAPTKIKTAGNLAFEIPKVKVLEVAPLKQSGHQGRSPRCSRQRHQLGCPGRPERRASPEIKCCGSPKANLLVAMSSFAIGVQISPSEWWRTQRVQMTPGLLPCLSALRASPQDSLAASPNLKGGTRIVLLDASWRNSQECHQIHAVSVATQAALSQHLNNKSRQTAGSNCSHSK